MQKSAKPRKQRKARYQAALHKRQKLLTATLSKELRNKWEKRSLPLRKGDKVEVMRGDWTGEVSEVRSVDLKSLRVELEGVKRRKVDGSEVRPALDPSNLRIISVSMSDPKRRKILERIGKKVLLCKKCDRSFTSKKALQTHKLEEHKPKFRCKQCSREFDSERGLKIHRSMKHKKFRCKKCGREFKSELGLRIHQGKAHK